MCTPLKQIDDSNVQKCCSFSSPRVVSRWFNKERRLEVWNKTVRPLSCCSGGEPKNFQESGTTLLEVPSLPANLIIDRHDDLTKPQNDSKSYRYLKLKNGARLLLVSDPETTISSAALDINVGTFSDPTHLNGLSHLCEHVLFTGSEPYPNQNFYEYCSMSNGSFSAFTSSEHTNFHFQVPEKIFEESLKKFATYFESPIFKESAMDSELEVVHSEHEKNIYNDVCRANQVERATADPNHVLSRLFSGSKTTLSSEKCQKGQNLRYELYNFYKDNYSSNLMTICLIHNTNLDSLEALGVNVFMNLTNKNIPITISYKFPYKSTKKKISIVPIKDIFHINLTFYLLKDFSEYYASAPEGIVSQLIGYRGPGGLFSYLRNQGLANHLVAAYKRLARGIGLFLITIQGRPGNESRAYEAIEAVFSYINLLKRKGPQTWFFEELRSLSLQQFEQNDKEKGPLYASSITFWMQLYPPKDILCGDYILSDWRPDLVDEVLTYLHPDNLRISILSKQNVFITTQVEPHCGADYHIEKIPSSVINNWKNAEPKSKMSLPIKNEFIITNGAFLIPFGPEEDELPKLIIDEGPLFKVWYSPSSKKYNLPNSYAFFKFSFSDSNTTATMSALNSLFVFLIRDSLVELFYLGELAGIFSHFKATKKGIELKVRGYSEKQNVYLCKLIKRLQELNFNNKERFKEVHDTNIKLLKSFESENLKLQAKQILSTILCKQNFPHKERLKALKSISLSDVRSYAKSFFYFQSIEAFFYGNVSRSQINDVVQTMKLGKIQNEDTIESQIIEEDVHFQGTYDNKVMDDLEEISTLKHQRLGDIEEYKLCAGSQELCVIYNELHSISCVLINLQLFKKTTENLVIMELFFNLTHDKLISYLKNAVSLNNSIHYDSRVSNGTLSLSIIIESQYPLSFIYDAINQGIEMLGLYINNEITLDYFETIKLKLATEKDEKTTTMGEEANHFWKCILEDDCDFNKITKEVSFLKKLTLSDVKTFYNTYISNNGSERRSLIISIGPDPTLNCLDSVETFTLQSIPFARRRWTSY